MNQKKPNLWEKFRLWITTSWEKTKPSSEVKKGAAAALGVFVYYMAEFPFGQVLLTGIGVALGWALMSGALAHIFKKKFSRYSVMKKKVPLDFSV
ncbi:MAG: hypothetical protein ACOC5S_01740 [Acidobacteriota bacterium]